MVSIHLFLALLFFIAASRSVRAADCSASGPRVREYTCFSYTVCENGSPKEITCPHDKYFDPAAMTCVKTTGNFTCGKVVNCKSKADGRYPNLEDKCRTFYTCSYERFLGHNYCPGSLVFNSELQLCDWDWAVAPPCGTAVPTTAMP